jgi:hypothetical protein
VHRGDDRDFAFGERAQQAPHRDVGRVAREGVEEIAEVVAGGKVLALAADGDQADCGIARGALERLGQSGVHRDRDRIAALGPRKRDGEDSAARVDPHMLAHLCPPNRVTGPAAAAIATSNHTAKGP